MKKFLPVLFLILILVPVFVFGQTPPKESPIIPDCGPSGECGYYDLLKLVNNIIGWIIMISIPVSAGVLAYAGFLYLTTAVADKRSEAKRMIQNVFIGLACILAAWIIVSTITNTLLKSPADIPVDLK